MLKIANIFERLTKEAALKYDKVLTEPIVIFVEDSPEDPEIDHKFSYESFSTIEPKAAGEQGYLKGVHDLIMLMGYDPDLKYYGEAMGVDPRGRTHVAIFPPDYDKDAWFAAVRQQAAAAQQAAQQAQQPTPEVTQKPTSLIEPPPAPVPTAKPEPTEEKPPKKRRRKTKKKKKEPPMEMPLGRPGDKPGMRLENVKESPWHIGIEQRPSLSEEELKKMREREEEAKRRPPHFSKRETPSVESVEEYIEIMEDTLVPGSTSHGDHLISAVMEKITAENAAGGEGWIGSSIIIINLEGKEYNYHYQWDKSPGRYKYIGDPYIIRFPKRSAAQKKMQHEEWVENYKESIANKHKESVPILQRGTGDVGEVFKMIDGALSMWFEMDKDTGSYRRISYATIDTTREELQPFSFIVGTKMFEEGRNIVPGTMSPFAGGEMLTREEHEKARKQMTERRKWRTRQKSKKQARRARLFKLTKVSEFFNRR